MSGVGVEEIKKLKDKITAPKTPDPPGAMKDKPPEWWQNYLETLDSEKKRARLETEEDVGPMTSPEDWGVQGSGKGLHMLADAALGSSSPPPAQN